MKPRRPKAKIGRSRVRSEPPRMGSRRVGPRRAKISRFFFSSPATSFALFVSLWVSSRGILVVFEAPQPCAHLEFSDCRVKPGNLVWPNLVLAKLGIGQKLVLAKLGIGQSWHWSNLAMTEDTPRAHCKARSRGRRQMVLVALSNAKAEPVPELFRGFVVAAMSYFGQEHLSQACWVLFSYVSSSYSLLFFLLFFDFFFF